MGAACGMNAKCGCTDDPENIDIINLFSPRQNAYTERNISDRVIKKTITDNE